VASKSSCILSCNNIIAPYSPIQPKNPRVNQGLKSSLCYTRDIRGICGYLLGHLAYWAKAFKG
ncbi:hypothetical protein, partial [Helicobacter vulpis]|uniref:hypothetical protein n=1 Tax=Helicobacter vulpis TaxID=2316076 RepID=UPI001969403A